MKTLSLLIGCLCLATACEDPSALNASEQPDSQIEITGYLDGSRIHTTLSSSLSATTPVTMTILGESQAAPPLLTVIATNQRDSSTSSTTAGVDGSFVLYLEVLQNDAVHLSLEGVTLPTVIDIAAEETTEFPALADEDGIYLERAGFHHNYIFLGVELAHSLEEGHLEVRNLSTGYQTVLIGQNDRDHDWMDWLDPEHDADPSEDDLFDLGMDVYFGATLWAEAGQELLLYHNVDGVYSQSITLTAP